MSELVVLPDLTQVAQEAARRWVAIAQEAAAERGSFSVALSGGSTPRALYTLLAAEPWRSQAPWDSTHVFWGDERRVPATDPQSNYRMARETLLEHVKVVNAGVHPNAKGCRAIARLVADTAARQLGLRAVGR